jgi:hypothetical protein
LRLRFRTLLALLVALSMPAVHVASCCLPSEEEMLATGPACPMHDKLGEECTCPKPSRDHVMTEGSGGHCRLVCDASHVLYQGPNGVLPTPISQSLPHLFASVVQIEDCSSHDEWIPSLSPPPRT